MVSAFVVVLKSHDSQPRINAFVIRVLGGIISKLATSEISIF